jgi:ribosomal protein S27AE
MIIIKMLGDLVILVGGLGGVVYAAKYGLTKLANKMCRKCRTFIWSKSDVVTCPNCGHTQVQ